MKYMIEHPTERRKMAEAARPLIASRYEQQAVWNALLEEYRSLESAWKKEIHKRKEHNLKRRLMAAKVCINASLNAYLIS